MEHQKNLYGIVFFVSLLITVVLIVIMLLEPLGNAFDRTDDPMVPDLAQEGMKEVKTTEEEEQSEKVFELREEDLKVILNEVMQKTIGFEIDTLLIQNDKMTVMSHASKEEIIKKLETVQFHNNAAEIALKIAPDTIEVDVDVSVTSEPETGKLELGITKLSVLGFKVPIEVLPEAFSTSITDTINQKRDEYGLSQYTVQLKNGKLILSGR